MKTHVLLLSGLLLHLPTTAQDVPPPQPAPTVGALGSTRRLVFEGNHTFPTEFLQQGLQTHGSWLLAAHPSAPLANYVRETQAALVRGYQRAGFPQVKVTTTRWLPDPQRLVCVIEEGPRYTAGEVTVTGAKSVPADVIISKLTTSEKKAAEAAGKEPPKNASKNIEWEKGKPAALDPTRPRELQEFVGKVLEQAGLMQAKVQIDIQRDDASHTASLHVQILAEGPVAVLGSIQCTGLRRDTEAALLKYLGLAKGQLFLSSRVPEIEEQLLQSARYTSYKVTATPRRVDQPEMDLKLELVEMPEAPQLGQPLHPAQPTLLKAAAWASEVIRTGSEDLLLKLSSTPKTGPQEDLEIIYNARHGLHLNFTVTAAAGQKQAPLRYTLRYTREDIAALFSTQEGRTRQWLSHPIVNHWMGDFFIKIGTDTPKDGTTSGNLGFGGGLKQKAGPDLLKVVLTLTPAAALLESLRQDKQWQHQDGQLILNIQKAPGEDEAVFRIDEADGRVRQIAHASWDKQHTTYTRFTATTATDAWDKATRALETDAVGLANSYDSKELLASWTGFLTAGYLHSGFGQGTTAQPAQIEQRVAAVKELTRSLSLSVPQTFGTFKAPQGDSFHVPPDPAKPQDKKLTTSMVAQVGLYVVDALVSEGSWPWLLAREVYYSTNGLPEYTGRILTQVRADPQLGPVGCYLASVLLDWTLPAEASGFRQLALTKLTAEDFRQDWGLLLQNISSSQRAAAESLLEKMRSGGREEIALLHDIFGSATPSAKVKADSLLDTFVQELRKAPAKPLTEVLPPIMDKLWNDRLADLLRSRITPNSPDGKAADPTLVAAIVGDSQITRESLATTTAARTRAAHGTEKITAAEQQRIEQEALNALIDIELCVVAFRSFGNTLTPAQLDADIQNLIKTEYKGVKIRFELDLKAQGVTLDQFRARREKMLIANVIQQKIRSMAPTPTEEEITRELTRAKDLAPPERQVQIRTLTLLRSSKNRGQDAQRQLINELHTRIKAGENIGVLAKKYSEDSRATESGLMDWLPPGQLSPAIADPLAKMKPGELSPVLDLGPLWIIIQFEAERLFSKPDTQQRKEVIAKLTQQKSTEFFQNWLKNARDKFAVQILTKPGKPSADRSPPDLNLPRPISPEPARITLPK